MAYQSTDADRLRAKILGVSYVLLAIVLAYMLFVIWPPTPWPSDEYVQKNPTTKAALDAIMAECKCGKPEASPSPVTTASPAKSDQAVASASVSPSSIVSASTGSPTGLPTTSPAAGPSASPSASPKPSPSGSPAASPQVSPAVALPPSPSQSLIENIPIKFFRWCINTSFDERLLMLVIIAGMLGSFVHASTSLADYIGNDNFNKNWTWFYLLRPAIGMSLALVFYFVVRGGFLTTSGGAKDINPFGIAALSGLVGMFSKQATDKLSEVFSTLFKASAGEGDDRRKGSLSEGKTPSVIEIVPKQLTLGVKGQIVTITGTNFNEKAVVQLNNAAQPTTFVSATQLTATVDDALIATAGTLKLKVVNPDKSESGEKDLPVG